MINHYIKQIADELFSTDFKAPFYILSVIAFWYVFFLAIFDIMELLTDLFSTHILPRLRRMWGACGAILGRMWGALGRALVVKLYLHVKGLEDRRKFYQEEKEEKGKEIKGGSYKEVRKNRIYIRKKKDKKKRPK